MPRGRRAATGLISVEFLRVERGEQVSYLAGLAGVVEGVDVLGAEAHHPAVEATEVGAPGGVAARREGQRGVAGCRRPQEPGQRAEEREPRAAPHGACRAQVAQHSRPGKRASGEPVLPRPPADPALVSAQRGRCLASPAGRAGKALAKGRSRICAAAGGSPQEITGRGQWVRRIPGPGAAALLSGF